MHDGFAAAYLAAMFMDMMIYCRYLLHNGFAMFEMDLKFS